MIGVGGAALGRRLSAAVAAVALAGASPAAPVNLLPDFDRFARATAADPMPARIAAFKAQLGALTPGFYPRRGTERDPQIAQALRSYPAEREAILAAAARIDQAYRVGTIRFARNFPDYRPVMPMFVVHSLGEMDGGMREIGKRRVLIFGADVIARLHAGESLDPLVDHELFHTYHLRSFPECVALWCSLWIEGLATYVAARLNPGATDRELLLDSPRPIRAATDARWAAALCFTRDHLDATDPATNALMFDGSSGGPLPARFGYYVGLRLAEQLGRRTSLAKLAHLPPERVHAALRRLLEAPGACSGSK